MEGKRQAEPMSTLRSCVRISLSNGDAVCDAKSNEIGVVVICGSGISCRLKSLNLQLRETAIDKSHTRCSSQILKCDAAPKIRDVVTSPKRDACAG